MIPRALDVRWLELPVHRQRLSYRGKRPEFYVLAPEELWTGFRLQRPTDKVAMSVTTNGTPQHDALCRPKPAELHKRKVLMDQGQKMILKG